MGKYIVCGSLACESDNKVKQWNFKKQMPVPVFFIFCDFKLIFFTSNFVINRNYRYVACADSLVYVRRLLQSVIIDD